MSISMRGAEQPFLDLPPAGEPGRHRIGRRPTASYRAVFAVREFRMLWSAQALSYLGDQVAQVAIAVLVYAKTGSPLVTALVYALTYLPPMLGGRLLPGIIDAFPRRQIMITLDLVRAALVEVMALPVVPLAATCLLLAATVLLGAPFAAARSAMLPQILPKDRLATGSAVGTMTFQASQVGGFLAGGILVAALGTYRSVALDALSFCLSAGLIAGGVRTRPCSRTRPCPRAHPYGGQTPMRQVIARNALLIFQRPAARTLVLFGWLAGFAVVPEGLAVPYAHTLGGGPLTASLLMTAMPAGTVIGGLVIGRLSRPDEQLRMIGVLAVLSCAPLAVSMLLPPLPLLVSLLVLAGAGGAYQMAAARAFVAAMPNGHRAQAFSVAQSGLLAVQGLGILVAGAAANWISPPGVVAAAGIIGMLAAAILASEWTRHRGALAGLARPDGPARSAGPTRSAGSGGPARSSGPTALAGHTGNAAAEHLNATPGERYR